MYKSLKKIKHIKKNGLRAHMYILTSVSFPFCKCAHTSVLYARIRHISNWKNKKQHNKNS